MSKTKIQNSVERDLVEGLEGLLSDLKADAPIVERYTCRRVVLDLEPSHYTPELVKATRELLKASQALFAKFLGVSVKTVHSWESNNGKDPSDMACRFMDEIQRNPQYWRERIKDSTKVKHCSE